MKKRGIFLLLAAFALLRLEHTGTEVSELEPVALVRITAAAGSISIRTDTGAYGSGPDLEKAVADLHRSSPAGVFLDTAEYLIINEEGQGLLPELWDLLRPACKVCLGRGRLDLEQAREYLSVHPPENTILDCLAEKTEMQILTVHDGRGRLEKE